METENKNIDNPSKVICAVFVENPAGEIVEAGMIQFERNDEAGVYETEIKIFNDNGKRNLIRDLDRQKFPRIFGCDFGGWRARAVVSPAFEVPPYIVIRALDAVARQVSKDAGSAELTVAVKPSNIAS